jgi:hypothetical protein
VLPIDVDLCRNTRVYCIIIRALGRLKHSIQNVRRHADAPLVDRVLLRKHESRKHLEWRLCGSAVSNLSKTSAMHIASFNNISIYLTVYSCFAFRKYTGIYKFLFRALLMLHLIWIIAVS